MAGLRVGVDIGGTFTDVAVEDGDRRWSVKVPTTHAAPEEGVMTAVAQGLAAANRTLGEVTLLVHGTTLATNALIERKGARTALLTTAGFRDVLEMGNEGRFDQYDLRAQKPVPLIPRHLRFEAVERLRHDGRVLTQLDVGSVAAAARAMAAEGAEAVAITFLHAYVDGAHEAQARDIVTGVLGPDVPVSVSHEVSPEMREYERSSTTAANAYLQPVVSRYLLRLEARLRDAGLTVPMLMILSSGSLTTVETAARFPIRLLESGPAGGAIFASDIARKLGLPRVLSFDLGGTTAKFCLLDDGEARHAASFEVGRTHRFKKGSGLPIRVPVIDLVEIGAGGGSIARVDAVGRVTVGPDSAGSEPGPACYGRGGTDATVTDCDLAQGKLDPLAFAGGTMPLDPSAAATAIDSGVGAATGLATADAAYGVTETVTESMAAAARVHAAEIGTDVEGRTLVAFGGGAPLQAARFAEKLGISEVVVPAGAGVGSAIGFLRAPLAYEVVRTARVVLPGGDMAPAVAALADMESEARGVVAKASPAEPAIKRAAYIRYLGQGHEIEVALDADPAAPEFRRAVRRAFEDGYRRLYGRIIDGAAIEVTAWTLRAQIAPPPVEIVDAAPQPSAAIAAGTRRVYNGAKSAWEDWPEYDRDTLPRGAHAQGPAIISEAETTTVVPASFGFSVDAHSFIRLSREAQP